MARRRAKRSCTCVKWAKGRTRCMKRKPKGCKPKRRK